MAKRRSRIAYVPGSRRKSSVSDRNQSAVSNATRNKETNVSTSTINQDKLKSKKAESHSSNEEHLSPHRQYSRSKRTEAESRVTPQSKQRVVLKKIVFGRRTRAGKEDGIPERIRDMIVTRRTYAKWKLLSLSTKKYTKQVIDTTVLSVLNGVHNDSKRKDIQVHLKQLSERIVSRLDSIKGPTQNGDYSKMETESHELEDALISCNNQVDSLEKELDDQRRLLEQDEEMLNSYSDQQNQQERAQLHPLLQVEPVNSLNLPSLSSEECNSSTVLKIPPALESDGQRLAQALAKIRNQTEKLGFRNWLEAVSDTSNNYLNS